MIRTIAKKEFLSNLMTFRFLVGFLLCEVLVVSSGYVLSADHERRFAEYVEAAKTHRNELNTVRVYSQLRVTLDRRPEVLGMLCEGADRRIGTSVMVAYDRAATEWTGYGAGYPELGGLRGHGPDLFQLLIGMLLEMAPLNAVFRSVDFVVVVQVVLSMLALLFSYDAISGEREGGTLALMLSNPVSRDQVILGKYLGNMAVLSFLVLAGFLSALILMLRSTSADLRALEWVRMGVILVLSLVYLSGFLLLGMLVSARVSRSSTGLILLFFLWVVLVMLTPNFSGYVARRMRPVESAEVVVDRARGFEEEFWDKMSEYQTTQWKRPRLGVTMVGLSALGGGQHGPGFLPQIVLAGGREAVLGAFDLVTYCAPLRVEMADKIGRAYEGYHGELGRQASLVENLSRLSPGSVYRLAACVLAQTDPRTYMKYLDGVRRYRRHLVTYMREKKAFSSLAYFTRMKEEKLLPDDEFKRQHKLARARGERWEWRAVPPLDLSDMPRFAFRAESIGESMRRVLPDLLILVVANVLLFMGVYLAFLRRA